VVSRCLCISRVYHFVLLFEGISYDLAIVEVFVNVFVDLIHHQLRSRLLSLFRQNILAAVSPQNEILEVAVLGDWRREATFGGDVGISALNLRKLGVLV
jgi:hypothetical protein